MRQDKRRAGQTHTRITHSVDQERRRAAGTPFSSSRLRHEPADICWLTSAVALAVELCADTEVLVRSGITAGTNG